MRAQIKLRQPRTEDVDKLLELDEAACIATTGRPLSNRDRRRKTILSVVRDKEGKHYSWTNLDILKKETLAFKRRWEKKKQIHISLP